MEVTKQWIAKVAGWKATKAGRHLFEKGVVSESAMRGKIITGVLRGSGKPTRVTVKIHSEIDIDVVCPRVQCRRVGGICEHAVALMLDVISEKEELIAAGETRVTGGVQEDQSVARDGLKSVQVLEIHFPPNFPQSLVKSVDQLGGLSIRLVDSSEVVDGGAVALARWLAAEVGNPSARMLGLKGGQALDFLWLLAEHPRVLLGGEQVRVERALFKIPLRFSIDEDRVRVELSEFARDDQSALYYDQKLLLWDGEERYLGLSDVGDLWKPRYWQRIVSGQAVSIPMREFIMSIEAQRDLIRWDDDSALHTIPIEVAEPKFELVIDGSTALLSAKLVAVYSADERLTIAVQDDAQIEFPLQSVERDGVYLTRNREAEDVAAGVLLQAGFQVADASGAWQLRDGEAVIEFLTAVLPLLSEVPYSWVIQTSNRLKSVKSNIVRVVPDFRLQGEGDRRSGQDWLAFDVGFTTDQGKEIPREVIQKMIAAGKYKGTSKNGKQVVISQSDAETIEGVLKDTNPRQENGLYYVASQQAAYLKRIRSYYSGAEDQQNVDLSIVQKLPERIKEMLRGYQEEGIAWLYGRLSSDSAALLADDMGLGKTLQTLSVLHILHGEQISGGGTEKCPNLVVCPTSLLGNWKSEIEKFYPEFKVLVLHGGKRKDYFSVAGNADVIITSYALIARDLEFYQKQEFQALVIDEASLIRNPDTQSAKALRKINAHYRIAMTGTPVENAIRDLWSLYEFLLPGYLGSRKEFQRHYEQPINSQIPDVSVMRRLRMRVEPFMLRRTKAKVAKDLPPKMHQVIYSEPSATQKNTYMELLKKGVKEVDQLEDGAAKLQLLTVLLRLRQASCDLRLLDPDLDIPLEEASAKLSRLVELLLECKRGGHRVLVFSQFTGMLSLVKLALDEVGISYSYLDGSTRNRAEVVDEFQAVSGPDTFLISLKAGGYGLNLTAADTVVHFDPWWNPAVEEQATDRAYRIGQTKPTTVYKMVSKGTVEEKIVKLQQAKQGLIKSTLGEEGAPLMQGLSQLEIAGLLKT